MTPFRALWRTDLRRAMEQAKSTPFIVILFVALSVILGDEGAEDAALALGGTSILYGVAFAALGLKDRFDGTLEFMAGLPVTGRAVAAGRLAAVATLSVLGGLQIAGATALVVPPGDTALARGLTVAWVGLGSWGALTTVTFAGVALLTRYSSTGAINRIMIGFVAFFVAIVFLMDAFAPDAQTLQTRLLTTPWQLGVLGILLLCGGVLWWSLGLMARGVERHVPTPDSVVL